MEILSGLETVPDPRIRAPIVTWGVFDGVHLGHRKVVDAVLSWARGRGASSVVLTFDRHPEEVLTGRPVPLLASLDERLRLMGELGVDFCLVLRFTPQFSKKSGEEFVREVVAGKLGASGVVLGHDSRFGRGRGGDFDALARLGEDLGLEVRCCEPLVIDGVPISSSLIREAVAAGRIEEAARYLGRSPSAAGTVVRGDRLGTRLGFPTANLEMSGGIRPPRGVYAVEAALDGVSYLAVANLGTRPTVRPEGEDLLEVHLLDYPGGDLYGRAMEVRFLSRLRDELKFPDLDALRGQIERDIATVRGRRS